MKPNAKPNDRIILDGFPVGWFVQDRLDEDTALLCVQGTTWIGNNCVCVRPRAITTDLWLPQARRIAHAVQGDRYREIVRRLTDFLEDWSDEMDMERVADLHSIIGGATP